METPSSQEHVLPAPRNRWVSSLVFGLVIFSCGAAAGVAVGMRLEDDRGRPEARHNGPSSLDRMVSHLKEDLRLDEEQTTRVREVLSRHRDQLHAIHDEISPQLKAALETLRQEVAAVLTDEQLILWEEKIKKIERRTIREKQPDDSRPGTSPPSSPQ